MATEIERYENIIASIATSVVSQIEGVADLTIDSGATFSGKLFRSNSNCVQVTILGSDDVIIDVNIKAYYGIKASELAYTIQSTVKEKVEDATPYKVKAINVNVVGVVFK